MDNNNIKEQFLKTHINGTDYIKKYVPLIQTGNIFKGLCIFHNEKTPSLTIYPKGYINSDHKKQDHDTWYCFGCHCGGDIITFKQKLDDLTREEALYKLAEEHNITFDQEEQLTLQKLAIENIKNKQQIYSLSDINIICSIAGRNCLRSFKEHAHFPNIMKDLNIIYQYLDNKLSELNASEAQFLIHWFNNELTKIYTKYKTLD